MSPLEEKMRLMTLRRARRRQPIDLLPQFPLRDRYDVAQFRHA